MNQPLVLSLFPGIGLLDMAFEEEGFCVVRGPDVLWGGDIRRFHPPAGVFDGVIGGPPCQVFSSLAQLNRAVWGSEPSFGNLIPEYERCVKEARPTWFVMENVPQAPEPKINGYAVHNFILNNRWVGAEQHRQRRFSFGDYKGTRHLDVSPDVVLFEQPVTYRAVTSNVGGFRREFPSAVTSAHASNDRNPNVRMLRYKLPDACELQGLPRDFTEHMPFRKDAKLKAVANGVPLPMGRAIARAVKRAMGYGQEVA